MLIVLIHAYVDLQELTCKRPFIATRSMDQQITMMKRGRETNFHFKNLNIIGS